MKAIVSVKDAVKDYTLGKVVVPALRGVTLEVDEGEFISIAGPSGSGKTTLLNLIGCVDTPTSGTVEVAGKDTRKLSERAADRPAPAHHRLHLPELQPGVGAQRVPERRAAAAAAAQARRPPSARKRRDGAARAGRPARARQAPPERAVGRPAPARRHRARAGHAAAARAGRRADGEPRLGDRPEHPRPDEGAEPHREDDLHLLDARRAGDGARQRGRAAGRRQARRPRRAGDARRVTAPRAGRRQREGLVRHAAASSRRSPSATCSRAGSRRSSSAASSSSARCWSSSATRCSTASTRR